MDRWSQFYLLPVDLGHTKLERQKKKRAKGSATVCVFVYACMHIRAYVFKQMLLKSSALLLYCPTNDTCVPVYFYTQRPDMQRLLYLEADGVSPNSFAPVMLILADHFEVPSSTLCLICFIWVTWVALMTLKTS